MTRIKKKSIVAISEIGFFNSKKYKNDDIWLGLAASRNFQIPMCNMQFTNCFLQIFFVI